MFVNIKGRSVKLGTPLTINTGGQDRRVILKEQHRGTPNQVCVMRNSKKFLVAKSKIIKIG